MLTLVRRSKPTLTDREREIVKLIARGLTNKQIAEKLGCSRKTVDAHRANVHRKFGFGSTARLVRWAIEAGIA